MGPVFKALADPTRRGLLDALFAQDGQSLSALEQRLAMTRFGVMKHLKVLEDAGLVVTRRRGREKLHFLNPVPIRLVHDRWVSKYAEPWVAGAERTQERDGGERHGEGVRDLHQDHPGAALGGDHRAARCAASTTSERGQTPIGRRARATRTCTPARRASSARARTWRWIRRADSCRALPRSGAMRSKREGTSRVTWEIEPVGDSCRLTVTHDQLAENANPALVRRLADDPLGAEDTARDRRDADHSRIADVRQRSRVAGVRRPRTRARITRTTRTTHTQSQERHHDEQF